MAYGIQPEDRFAMILPLAFAASITPVFETMFCGATNCLFDPITQGLSGLAAWVDRAKVTAIKTSPSVLRAIATTIERAGGRVPLVRLAVIGGEPATWCRPRCRRSGVPECDSHQSLRFDRGRLHRVHHHRARARRSTAVPSAFVTSFQDRRCTSSMPRATPFRPERRVTSWSAAPSSCSRFCQAPIRPIGTSCQRMACDRSPSAIADDSCPTAAWNISVVAISA